MNEIRKVLLMFLSLFSLCILSGFSYIHSKASSAQKMYYKNYGISHFTRYNMQNVINQSKKGKVVPNISSKNTKPIPGAKDDFTPNSDNIDFRGEPLSVWDSWDVKNSDGSVANFNGYHVVFALVGNSDKRIHNYMPGKIGMFYQKIKDAKKGIKTWHYGGVIFNSNIEGVANKNNSVLKHETGEWSGSSILQKDGYVRLFYTSFSGSKKFGGDGRGDQTLATAKIGIKNKKNGLYIDHKKNTGRKPIFSGDGKYYESLKQGIEKHKQDNYDEHCLRDPDIITDNGHKYLVFEGNTGNNVGPSGENSLYNLAYYGGNKQFAKEQENLLFNQQVTGISFSTKLPLGRISELSNACIGIIELNNNYSVKKVMKPLVAFNLTQDETERPSIIKHNNRWYLFTAMHGWHMASNHVKTTDSYLIGFSSKSLKNGYQPMNKNGLVLYSDKPTSDETFTYSYNVLQSKNDSNSFLVSNYIVPVSSLPNAENIKSHSTFGPTLKLYLNGNNSVLSNKTLKQGQLTN